MQASSRPCFAQHKCRPRSCRAQKADLLGIVSSMMLHAQSSKADILGLVSFIHVHAQSSGLLHSQPAPVHLLVMRDLHHSSRVARFIGSGRMLHRGHANDVK